MTTERKLKEAILKKDTSEITKFTREYVDSKLDAWKINETSKDEYAQAAVTAVLKGYQKFDPKKRFNSAMSFIIAIASQSISTSIWSNNK